MLVPPCSAGALSGIVREPSRVESPRSPTKIFGHARTGRRSEVQSHFGIHRINRSDRDRFPSPPVAPADSTEDHKGNEQPEGEPTAMGPKTSLEDEPDFEAIERDYERQLAGRSAMFV